CRRSYAHQAGDHALHRAHHRRPPADGDVAANPSEDAGGGADVRVEHRHRRVGVGGEGVAAVEAGPPHPQDARAGHHRHQVATTRHCHFLLLLPPWSHPVRGRVAGDAGGEVNDVAAGVVHDAPVEEEAPAPNAVRSHRIGQRRPQRHERHPRLDAHAPEHGAGDQPHGDAGGGPLEEHHARRRVQRRHRGRLHLAVGVEVEGEGEQRLGEHVVLGERRGGAADEGQEAVAEGHVVRPERPARHGGGHGVERHECGGERALAGDGAGVEEGETGEALQGDERGGEHLPGVVALVQPLR
ncbi:Os12g0105150, partial [Oryza sativa Japonica Group]